MANQANQELEAFPPTTEQDRFNKAYWEHFPPTVRNLPRLDYEARIQEALRLSNSVTIDAPIMIWGWDPYLTMTMRKWYGYTWVPSAFQPQIAVAPGLWVPGALSYDPNKPPPGSVKVSTDLKDFPPYEPSALPSSPVQYGWPGQSPVGGPVFPGKEEVGSLWFSAPGEHIPAGHIYHEGSRSFRKFETRIIGGYSRGWERIA